MLRDALAWVVSLTAVFCLGCGGDSPSASELTLADGTVVQVAGDGSLAVVVDGSTVFATAPGARFTAREFEPRVDFAGGFFRFRRSNVTEATFRYEGAELLEGAAVLTYGGDAGVLRVHVSGNGESTDVRLEVEGDAPGSLAVPLRCDEEASFLGFGGQYELTDQRGEIFDLWVREQGIGRTGAVWNVTGDRHHTYFPVPYFMDARGFGLVVNTDERVLVDLCATDAEVAWVEVENVGDLSLQVLHGPEPRDVVRQLGDLHGRPQVPADWAWGPWLGIQGGDAAVIAEADALDAAEVPYTALWAQDWVGRQDITAGLVDIVYHWVADETLYPDLRGTIDELHSRDKHFLGYINPFVIREREHYDPMAAMGLLIQDDTGAPYVFGTFKGESSLPDLTNDATRDFVRTFMTAMVDDYGMDGWMADFAETLPHDAVLSNGEPSRMEHNRYPVRWQELNNGLMREERGDDYAIFSRSGWLGSQATAQIVWIGDQEADWEHTDGLPTVIPALLNLGLSGVPFVTHDIAGYSGGPSTKELFLRWTELGAFTPVMRTHEGLAARTNWSWDADAETTAHFRRFARIHQALVPEIATLADEAATRSMPILRHMVLEFPDDRAVVGIDDQFMFGPDLLVAPVVEEGATSREVYLPAGDWFHVFTGERFEGGGEVAVDAPIGTPPVFHRGSDRTDLRAID
ncbi:MAG: hypothetical protein JJ863_12200 [Deltaproteobacteria bacterium]|nr:hypothetical protein [Deltaproteobacteria bacterium]